jgi:hypothetical protein
MISFVQLQTDDTADFDWVNLRNVARVHAEGVTNESWVVKVLLTTGTEIIDSRHTTKEDAQNRVIEILPGED